MDPILLKQRQEFMMQAIKSMGVMQQLKTDNAEQQSHSSTSQQQKKPKKKIVAANGSSKSGSGLLGGQQAEDGAQTAANFSLMAKIVDYMRKRHLSQQHWPLSLRETLDEMQVYDVNRKSMLWLQEALPLNPRLQTEADGNFSYKPPHRVKNRATLLALLKKNDSDNKGGLLLSELNDCVPNAESMVKSLGTQVITIPTQVNKRKDVVYFYNNADFDYQIDDEFVQLWRLAGVEHLDENKIEEYLQKHGLDSARDLNPRKAMAKMAPKRKQPRNRGQQRVHNVHLEGVLEDYAAE